MKHKINHIEAAVVIAIALTLIVPIAPVFAQTDKTNINEPMPSKFEDFTEGFEDDVVPPTGWLNVDYDGASDLTFNSEIDSYPTSDFNNWVHWVVTWNGSSSASGVHW